MGPGVLVSTVGPAEVWDACRVTMAAFCCGPSGNQRLGSPYTWEEAPQAPQGMVVGPPLTCFR